jgi:hypothetical protein
MFIATLFTIHTCQGNIKRRLWRRPIYAESYTRYTMLTYAHTTSAHIPRTQVEFYVPFYLRTGILSAVQVTQPLY